MAQPTYYLYVKKHNKTGLKYLGQTKAMDPCKYKGSGKYWTRHITKYGYDVNTTILLVTNNKKELSETGLFFSKLYNVVNSKQWANLKEECGDGGWDHILNNPETMAKKAKSVSGENNPMYGKRGELSPIYGKKQSEDHKRKRLDKVKGRKQSDESRLKMSLNRPKGPSGKKWFNNGIMESFDLPENKPIGFEFGRLRRKV